MKTLELSPIQNAILVRLATNEHLTMEHLIDMISARCWFADGRGQQKVRNEIGLQIHLLALHRLIEIRGLSNGKLICIASQRARDWLPIRRNGYRRERTNRVAMTMFPTVIAAALAASGCGTLGDTWKSEEPAPVIARYEADRAVLQERVEQFRDSRGNMVYRYCVGDECPQPTPKRPAVRKLPIVKEIAEDGSPLPSEPPASVPMRKVPPPRPSIDTATHQVSVHKPTSTEKSIGPGITEVKPKNVGKMKNADATPRAKSTPVDTAASEPAAKAEEPRPAPHLGALSEATPIRDKESVQATGATGIEDGDAGRVVAAWANLWSERNVEAYFALYAPTFKPATGQRVTDWMNARASIMKRASKIDVTIQNMKVVEKNGAAIVSFAQKYESPRFKSRILKQLHLIRVDGLWKIDREIVVASETTR